MDVESGNKEIENENTDDNIKKLNGENEEIKQK